MLREHILFTGNVQLSSWLNNHLISSSPVLTLTGLSVSPFHKWLSCRGVTCGDQEITSCTRLQRPSGRLDMSFLVLTDVGITDWIRVWWAWCWVSHQRAVKISTGYRKRCSTADHLSYIQLTISSIFQNTWRCVCPSEQNVGLLSYMRRNKAEQNEEMLYPQFSWVDINSIMVTDREKAGNKPN